MSGIVLCGTSAELILEREALDKGYGLEPTNRLAIPTASSYRGMSDVQWSIQIDGIVFTHLDVLVGSARDIRHCKNATFHTWKSPLPESGISKISDPFTSDFFVTSGSFMALMASRRLPRIQLAQYVMYLCGRYCIHQPKPLEERKAFTSTAEIAHMLLAMKGTKGWAKLEQVLPFCADGIRSPQEANYYLVATCPCKRGGYHLIHPKVNYAIPLEYRYEALLGEPSIEVDFYWPEAKLVVEYNGLDNHDGGISPLDVTQQLILGDMGIEVLFLTKYQFFDASLLDTHMQTVAKKLGIEPDSSDWPDISDVRNLLKDLRSQGR